jgi:tRNA A37 methylthiotransferase MiaB
VLVDAESRRRDHEVSGRTSQNVVVNVPAADAALGSVVRVRIARSGAYSVWGRRVDDPQFAGANAPVQG